MRIVYGTTNPGKLAVMKRALAPIKEIELIGLHQVKAVLREVPETGNSPLENASIKAKAYYEMLKMPVFSCDSGLYFEGLPREVQPGIHVRNVGGKYLTDEEMTAYYSGLAKKYGEITARYKNAVCFVWDENHIYESMAEGLSGEPFLLTSVPHPKRQKGFPLDCLSKDIATGNYYYDMGEYCQDDVALHNGFLQFFQNILAEKLHNAEKQEGDD